MKMIYIPPLQMITETGKSRMQLMLPHMTTHETYARHFQKARDLGKYTILDNGAAEGVNITPARLSSTAWNYKVDELVLPDVMGNPELTFHRALDFHASERHRIPVKTKLGYVLHGNSATATYEAYLALRETVLYKWVRVLYLPRRLITGDDPFARLNAARLILEVEGTADRRIHFLGASPIFLREPRHAAVQKLPIRSMDTSAPFVYAIRGRSVDGRVHIRRDVDTYFGTPMSNATKELALANMATMDGWTSEEASLSSVRSLPTE